MLCHHLKRNNTDKMGVKIIAWHLTFQDVPSSPFFLRIRSSILSDRIIAQKVGCLPCTKYNSGSIFNYLGSSMPYQG